MEYSNLQALYHAEIFFLIVVMIVAICQKSIWRASFAQTVLRAKTMGTRVIVGGKVRTT